jgi:SOS-response transcriptional repressor LexA
VLALLTGVTSPRRPATLKRYFREPDKFRLEPSYHPIAPNYVRPEDVQVQGKVTALIRKV